MIRLKSIKHWQAFCSFGYMYKSFLITLVFSLCVFNIFGQDNNIPAVKIDELKTIYSKPNDTTYIINFFATWCPPCKAEIPNLIKLQEDYKNDIIVLSVLLEEMKTNEEILAFIKEYKINYAVINGPEGFDLAKNLGGIKSIPTMYLINKESTIFQKYVGIVPNEMMEIDIKKVLEK